MTHHEGATCVISVRVRTEPEVKAEALREAADALYGDNGPEHPLSTATWLRERASRIETA
jgi:hypothetical protein